jgi:histidinol dehydrogenase
MQAWKQLKEEERSALLSRSESDIREVTEQVRPIIEDVARRGDEALREYALRFDSADLSQLELRVREEEFDAAERKLSEETKEALRYAVDHTRRFHRSQIPAAQEFVELSPGLFSGERALPIASAGLYVPRGRGSFPSMLYMLAVPAVLAGVPAVQVVTPSGPDGTVDPACLYTARLVGVSAVYRIGGAHAVAALAYGTRSVPAVHKIVGPGSSVVTAAKRLVSGKVDIGLPAGPSESMILADDAADPWNTALDLLVEAEHGADSCAMLITPSTALAEAVAEHCATLIEELPEERRRFVEAVFTRYGGILLTEDEAEGVEIVNRFGPEHLQLRTRAPFTTLSAVTNAGEILLGEHLPFSAANYATGVNAVLPTGGWARSYGPVSVRDFIKYSSVVYAEPPAYRDFAPRVERIAEYEGFSAHARAVRMRREAREE